MLFLQRFFNLSKKLLAFCNSLNDGYYELVVGYSTRSTYQIGYFDSYLSNLNPYFTEPSIGSLSSTKFKNSIIYALRVTYIIEYNDLTGDSNYSYTTGLILTGQDAASQVYVKRLDNNKEEILSNSYSSSYTVYANSAKRSDTDDQFLFRLNEQGKTVPLYIGFKKP